MFLNIECFFSRIVVLLFFMGTLVGIGIFAAVKTKECYKVTGTIVSFQIITKIVTVSYIDPMTGVRITRQIQANYNYSGLAGDDIYLYINKKRPSDVSDLQPFTVTSKIIYLSVLAFVAFLLSLLLYKIFKDGDFCRALSFADILGTPLDNLYLM